MPDLATAYVQILPSAEGISGKLENIFSGEADSASKKVGNNFGSKFIKASAGAIAAGGAAIVGAAGTIIGAVTKTAAAGDEIDKTSQKLGVSAKFYQEWDAVLQHSGTSMGSMTATFKQLSNAAASGSKTQVEAFKAIGLSMEEVQNMSSEDLFSAVISGLQGMESGSERTALATKLLGRGAMELGPLLNTSAEDTQKMIDTVNELGGVMSDESVKAAAAFQDAMQDMQTALGGVSKGLAAEFLPSITTVVNGMAEMIAGKEGGLEKVTTGIDEFITKLGNMIPKVLDTGTKLVDSFLNVLIDNLPQIVEMGIEFIIKLAAGIISKIPFLVSKAPEIVMAVVNGIKSAMPSMADAGTQLVNGLWNGLSASASWLKSKISGWVGDVMSFIKGLFGIHSPSTVMRDQVGKFLAMGIGEGITDGAGYVSSAMDDMLGDVTTDATANIKANVSSVSGGLASSNVQNSSTMERIEMMLDAYLPKIGSNIVLNNGAMVGQMVGEMDRQMGMRAAIAGRGI